MNVKMTRMWLALAVAAVVAGGLQALTSAPAQAAPGLVRVLGPVESNAGIDKSTSVLCPISSPRIVGGGLVINDNQQRVAFARFMQPTKNFGPNGEDLWSVAATVRPGFSGASYTLQAVAVCATNAKVPGHEVRFGPLTTPSSAAAQNTSVGCSSSSKRVIGSGGGVVNGGQVVGIQTIRPSGPRDISRVFGQAIASTSSPWQMRAFTICMTSNDNTSTTGAAIPGFTGTTLCTDTPDAFVYGPGGGAWNGIGLLNQLFPSADLKANTVTITSGSTAVLTSAVCLP
jgi:hypothetical protein